MNNFFWKLMIKVISVYGFFLKHNTRIFIILTYFVQLIVLDSLDFKN